MSNGFGFDFGGERSTQSGKRTLGKMKYGLRKWYSKWENKPAGKGGGDTFRKIKRGGTGVGEEVCLNAKKQPHEKNHNWRKTQGGEHSKTK